MFFPTIKSKNAPRTELNHEGQVIAENGREGGRTSMVLLRDRQILPAHLTETCLFLISVCSDPLCRVSTAIKQSSLLAAHMRSAHEK